MAALGGSWKDVTAKQVYTVYDLHPFLADELDYEMDCRRIEVERVVVG